MKFDWFVVWAVVTQGVNLAFYLQVTRVVRGWGFTLGAYLVGYLFPLCAALRWINPDFHGGVAGAEGSLAFGFMAFFVIWGLLVLAMSRGPTGHRLSAVLVCGVHQVCAFVFSLVLIVRLPDPWGDIAGSLLMTGLGALLFFFGLPRVLRRYDDANWWGLNVMALMNFLLLYAAGISPIYAPGGHIEDVLVFFVACVVAVAYFPVAKVSSEKRREANLRRQLEGNARILLSELRVSRASEDGARRVRHDARHHAEVLRGMLKSGAIDAALHYIENTLSHELLPLMNARWCENEIVNAILSAGKGKVESHGLRFEAEARVPGGVRIGEPDLVALVSNLIENAANGGTVGGEVRVSVTADRGALRIGVSNPVEEGFELVEGLPCANPGVGIFSVRSVVEKYHGLFDYDLKGGVLTARVMIGGAV